MFDFLKAMFYFTVYFWVGILFFIVCVSLLGSIIYFIARVLC